MAEFTQDVIDTFGSVVQIAKDALSDKQKKLDASIAFQERLSLENKKMLSEMERGNKALDDRINGFNETMSSKIQRLTSMQLELDTKVNSFESKKLEFEKDKENLLLMVRAKQSEADKAISNCKDLSIKYNDGINELTQTREILSRQEDDLKAKEDIISARSLTLQNDLFNYSGYVSNSEEKLKSRESNIVSRENSVINQESLLRTKQETVLRQDADLKLYAQSLSKLNESLTTKERQLEQLVASVNASEAKSIQASLDNQKEAKRLEALDKDLREKEIELREFRRDINIGIKQAELKDIVL